MQKPERSNYTALDFRSWKESGTLILTPKFQRRGVWTTPARSSLIQTLIEGYPVPPIYLRIAQSEDMTRTVREVVDGQQRLSALLDFIDGKYALSRSIGASYAGQAFSALTSDQQSAIREYSFNTEVLYGVSDAEVLEIFSRLNRYSVRLNNQELRNGKYFGRFKQTCYELAFEHLEFWRNNRIFTENGIARMLEVELVSELLIMHLDGLQDKKLSINDFYEKYDENFPNRIAEADTFRATIDQIAEAIGGVLSKSEFRRPPLFYSLYGAVLHRTKRIPGAGEASEGKNLNKDELASLRDAVLKLSEIISAGRRDEPLPAKYQPFVNACLRQTDNLQPRSTRFETLYREAFG